MTNAIQTIPNKFGGLSGATRSNQVLLRLIRQGPLKHLNPQEFDEAIVWCELYGANPLARDIYFFVFHPNDPEKRNVVPILAITLLRKIASRAKDYRPDDRPARFTYDAALVGPGNPKGIVDCEVTVWKHSHGDWHPITERLGWTERAPLVTERWEGPKGARRKIQIDTPILDPTKQNWATMPETMLAKCVEAAALRKGWPELMSGTYAEGELDRAEVLDLTATEVLHKADAEVRALKVGGGIIVDWCDGEPLASVPYGSFADTVMGWADRQRRDDDPQRVRLWLDRNVEALRLFWAREPGDCLELKRRLEEIAQ